MLSPGKRIQVGLTQLHQNATIWTGKLNGLEILTGDLLLDKGLIKDVGVIDDSTVAQLEDLVVIHANGSWVSSGYGARRYI